MIGAFATLTSRPRARRLAAVCLSPFALLSLMPAPGSLAASAGMRGATMGISVSSQAAMSDVWLPRAPGVAIMDQEPAGEVAQQTQAVRLSTERYAMQPRGTM